MLETILYLTAIFICVLSFAFYYLKMKRTFLVLAVSGLLLIFVNLSMPFWEYLWGNLLAR
jgi:hypothetical protein